MEPNPNNESKDTLTINNEAFRAWWDKFRQGVTPPKLGVIEVKDVAYSAWHTGVMLGRAEMEEFVANNSSPQEESSSAINVVDAHGTVSIAETFNGYGYRYTAPTVEDLMHLIREMDQRGKCRRKA